MFEHCIYHLYVLGHYVSGFNGITGVLMHLGPNYQAMKDEIVTSLIVNHEFHDYNLNGDRIVDIMVSTVGEQVV